MYLQNPAPTPVDLEGFRTEMREAEVEEVVPVTLDTYREEAVEHKARLEEAVAAGDPTAIAHAAHAMKSAAGAIKAGFLADLLLELESAGKSGSLGATRTLIEPVRTEFAAVLGFLEHAAARGYQI